jgi:Zn-dependent peptidase ImmA (M78 family)
MRRSPSGDVLPGFEGALSPAPVGKKGWGIFYNSAITSRGRINFTLGHEFGHYLLHREAYPNGFQCSSEDMGTWESEYAQRENEANIFAATLLMPFDDFRAQIDAKKRPGFDDLGACASRYDVSLIAATLRWLQYTSRRSILVVSRDGFVLWARSSQAALKSSIYFKTRDTRGVHNQRTRHPLLLLLCPETGPKKRPTENNRSNDVAEACLSGRETLGSVADAR